MRSCWIVIVCPLCFFLNSPSASALEWSLGSSYSSVKNIENEVMDSLFKSRWRPKRAAVTVPQNYIADVEISFPNASLMEPLINFLKQLNIAGTFNTSDIVNITSITVTTACSLNVTTVQCSCEAGYDWPSGTCSASLNCSSSPKRCDCINTFPPEGTHCQLASTATPMLTTTYGPTPIKVHIGMSLMILEIFTSDLWNSSSDKYIRYKGLFETKFYNSYKQLGGFKSVHVTGFRNGSILVDYVIVADPVTPTALQAANQNVISDLKGNFTFPDAPFTRYVYGQTNFTISKDVVFEGDNLVMTCRTVSNSTSVIWTQNNTITMKGSITTNKNGVSESNLTITSTTSNDSGVYTCMLNDSSVMYIANKTVSVFSISKRFADNMDIVCNDSMSELYNFCIIGDFSDFACSCTPNGILNINALKVLSGNCYTFSLGADASSCPPETSGSKTKYTCTCGTVASARVLRTDIITVTFTRQATVTIRGPTAPISETDGLVLNCASSVTNFESMTWQAVKNDGISVLPSDLQFYYYKNNNATLSIPNVARTWTGTYTCIVFQRVTSASSSIAVTIFPLPLDSQITTNIVNGRFACKPPTDIRLECCTSDNNSYLFQFTLLPQRTVLNTSTSNVKCWNYTYNYNSCDSSTEIQCIVSNTLKSVRKTIVLNPLKGTPSCIEGFMQGILGDTFMKTCPSGFTGSITYICLNTGWDKQTNSCILQSLGQLVAESQKLQTQSEIPTFLVNLNSNVTAASNSINNFASVNAIVNVLATLSSVTQSVTSSMMSDFLDTANVVVKKTETWNTINESTRVQGGSLLLQSTEKFSEALKINGTFEKNTSTIMLKGIVVNSGTKHFLQNFTFQNSSVTGIVNISPTTLYTILNASVISIAYSSMQDLLNVQGNTTVNGLVMTTTVVGEKNTTNVNEHFQISMMFDKINTSLTNATCVFWKFDVDGPGEWDAAGCTANETDNQVNCTCTHLTSFSVLMSSSIPNPRQNTANIEEALAYITYIGVGISIASLVICIIIETLVWKSITKSKTSYMRHVCLVNIAVSLLIADIWFMIGAGMSQIMSNATASNYTIPSAMQACDAATFFAHFFYLSLFFWMLTMGLILFYRMIYIFHYMSRRTMLTIAFSLGYGCPLVISVVTIAATRPQDYYREGNACWLNINNTHAFVAFVVPALTIVAVNFIILAVVIIKLLRPSIGDKPKKDEKSTLVKIAKSVAILTPVLGLTWGFGIGLVITDNDALKVIFTVLNSIQGFLILVLCCFAEEKIREALLRRFSLTRWASQLTKSTTVSTTRSPPAQKKTKARFFGARGAYNLSSALQSSSSEDTSNTYSVLQ